MCASRNILSTLLLLLYSICVNAQSDRLVVEHYSVEEGLASHRTYCVVQYEDGYAYVGTYEGLHRFDGYEFTRVPLRDLEGGTDYSNNVVWHIVESHGRLLLLLSGRYLTQRTVFEYYPDTGEIRRLFNADKVQLGPFRVEYVDRGDTVVFEGGFNAAIGQLCNVRRTVTPQGDLSLWIEADGDRINVTDPIATTGSHSFASCDSTGKLYLIATQNGVLKVSVRDKYFKRYLATDIDKWQYRIMARNIVEAGEKIIVCTEANGLFAIDPISGEEQELNVVDVNTGQEISLMTPRGVATDGRGNLYIRPGWQRVWRINLADQTAELIFGQEAQPTSLIGLRNGNLLVLTDDAIYLLDTESGEETVVFDNRDVGLLLTSSSVMYENSNGRIWLGNTQGAFLLDIDERRLVKGFLSSAIDEAQSQYAFPNLPILTGDEVIALNEIDGMLWIGFISGGANVIDLDTDSLFILDENTGLKSNTVCGFVNDERGMWLATYHGLYHYNTASNTMRQYFRDNGLSHDEMNRWSSLTASDGTIYIGTMNGVTSFHPSQFQAEQRDVDLLLSEVNFVNQRGERVSLSGVDPSNIPAINISPNNRSLSVKVALSDLRLSGDNRFEYRLASGSSQNLTESEWRNNGSDRRIRFEHLTPGNYHLEIGAVSSSGVRAVQNLIIPIVVQNHFYQKAWFIIALICVFLGVVTIFYRYRLQHAVNIERLRSKLSSDLHDDVGSVLSGVAYQMDLLEYTARPDQKQMMNQVAESSRMAMSRMRDVVWAIDSRKSSFQNLVDRMGEYAEEILIPLNIGFSLNSPTGDLSKTLTPELRHNLLAIFKEFITNTIKHATNATQVNLTFARRGSLMSMKIRDDGTGIADGKVESTGQGLDNMRMRAEKIDGKIEFSSENGFQVEVVFEL